MVDVVQFCILIHHWWVTTEWEKREEGRKMPQVRLLHKGKYLYYTTFDEFTNSQYIAHICIILTANYLQMWILLIKSNDL